MVFCVSKSGEQGIDRPLIVVDSSRGQNDSRCWYGGQDRPCLTLDLAIEGLLVLSSPTSHPSLFLQEGTYDLSQTVVLDGLGNFVPEFRMIGNNTHVLPDPNVPPPVVVNCSTGTKDSISPGFAFLNIYTSITIEYIWFYGCGALQFSTSQNDKHEFLQFQAGLYFLLCKNIFFNHVWVTNSPGIGVVIYATTGLENSFYSCNFSYNVVSEQSVYPGGGGLYLEFPYCLPANHSSCSTETSMVPSEYVSGSSYYFFECIFSNNSANVLYGNNETFIFPHKKEHIAFGRGGGFSVFFKGEALGNTVRIDRCNFTDNSALWGAGMFAEFQDNSRYNALLVFSSVLQRNVCPHGEDRSGLRTGGGGMRIAYINIDDQHVYGNQMVFEGCIFEHNEAFWGGGVSFSVHVPREHDVAESLNTLNFTNCQWYWNKAQLGAAVDLSVWRPLANQETVEVYFTNTTINSSRHYPFLGSLVGLGAMYINSVPTSFVGYTNFTSNPSTALVATTTVIKFHRSSITYFFDNSGRNGGAIALFGNAVIITYDWAELNFECNTAAVKGGAIYSELAGSHELVSSRSCFIQFQAITKAPDDWTVKFLFTNNTANGKPNSIFTTSVFPCVWGGASGPAHSDKGSKRVFCWNGNGDWWTYEGSTSSDSCSQQIETAPRNFSNYTYNMNIIPGQRVQLPLEIYDDFDRKTNGIILFADVNAEHNDYAMVDNAWKFTSDNSAKLFGVPNKTVLVDFYTVSPRVLHTQMDVTLSPCPPGYYEKNHNRETACVCARKGYNGLIDCTTDADFTANLQLQGSWIGYYKNSTTQMLAGSSPYIFRETISLPKDPHDLDQAMCGNYNRRGVLCGECAEGYGPAISSDVSYLYECVTCTEKDGKYGWLLFILAKILPITILFFILAVCNINLTSGVANSYIFFSQLITTSFGLYAPNSRPYIMYTKFYTLPYAIWNLNFFDAFVPNFCLHRGMKVATVISINYIVAIYPLFLILVAWFVIWLYGRETRHIYRLCKPVHSCYARHRNRWELKRSVTDAFAAFLLLSYAKFLIISGRLLCPQSLYDHNNTVVKTVLFFDGSIGYFEKDHVPYILIAVIVLIVFVFIPPLLLIAYPSKKFHKCLELCNWDTGGKVHQFLNTFYNCYKDGQAPNTHDWRCFAGLYFVLRLIFLFPFYFVFLNWSLVYAIQQILCIIGFLLFAIVRPYKEEFYNNVDTAMFGLLAAINALNSYNLHHAIIGDPSDIIFWIVYILIWCPLVCLLLYLMRYFWKSYDLKSKCCHVLKSYNLTSKCCHIWKRGEPLARNQFSDSIIRLQDEREEGMRREGQNGDNEEGHLQASVQECDYGSTRAYNSYPPYAKRASTRTSKV